MADIQFDITLDLVEKYVPAENVTVVQEDYQSVKFVYTILNREQPVDLSGATDIVVSFVKPDGHIVLQNDGTLVGSTIELVANPQAFTYVGKTYFQVQYKIGSSIYNTRQAFLWVERGNTSCQTLSSTDFAPMLDQAIQAGQMLSGIDLQALIDSKVTAENAQADVDALELRVGALEVTIVGLDSRVDALEASQTAQDTAISGLQASQATQDTKIATLETRQADLSSRVTSVEGNITTVVAEVDALQLTAVDHETRIDGLEASMPNLDPINTAISALQAKDVEQDGRIGANEIAISGLQTKNTQQDTAIAGNATGIANLQAEQTTQNNRLTAVENKNAAQDSAIGDIQAKDTAQDSAISVLQSSQATQDTDIAAIKVKNTQQDTAISANSTSIATVDTKVNANKSAQDTVNSGVSGSLSNHTTRIEDLEADATVDDARITNLEGDNTSNKNRIANVEGAIGVLNSDINDLQGNDAIQDSRLNAIETKNTTQDGQIATNSSAIASNKADADSKITGLTTRLGTAETDIVNLKAKDTSQDTRMTTIENKNDSQDTRMTTIEGKDVDQDNAILDNANQIGVLSKKISYKEKQSALYGKLMNKTRRSQGYIIKARGDSMTYGADSTSADKRPADPTQLPDGSYHGATRASKTYPEALGEFLNSVYSGGVSVINEGRTGDGVKQGFNRWIVNNQADVTIICYGTNDSREAGTGYPGDIDEFLLWYRKMIERELDWNTAVILMTPPKNRYDVRPDSYDITIRQLANEYGLPVLQADEMITGYSPSIYSDGTHFNGTGYTVWASRIAAAFIGKGASRVRNASGGTTLYARDYMDNVILYGDGIFRDTAGYPTPNEVVEGQGHAILVGPSGKATWSFYLEQEDTVVLPTANISSLGASIKLTLDFGVQQADVPIDYVYGGGVNHTDRHPSVVSWNYPNDFNGSTLIIPRDYKKGQPMMIIAQKGWHTITFEYVGTDTASVFGLTFYPYYDFINNTNNAKKSEVVSNSKDGKVTLALTSDATAGSATPQLAVRRGNAVTVSLDLQRNTGATGLIVTSLPVDMTPTESYSFDVIAVDGTPSRVLIRFNGEIHLDTTGKRYRIVTTFVTN